MSLSKDSDGQISEHTHYRRSNVMSWVLWMYNINRKILTEINVFFVSLHMTFSFIASTRSSIGGLVVCFEIVMISNVGVSLVRFLGLERPKTL